MRKLEWKIDPFKGCPIDVMDMLLLTPSSGPGANVFEDAQRCLIVDAIVHYHNIARSDHFVYTREKLTAQILARIGSFCYHSSFLKMVITNGADLWSPKRRRKGKKT